MKPIAPKQLVALEQEQPIIFGWLVTHVLMGCLFLAKAFQIMGTTS
jgi:hypothetical protein